MKFHVYCFLFLLLLVFVACDDGELFEDYLIEEPRILAIKIQGPEIEPQDTVSMRMLVGGETVDQTMTTTVFWFIDDTAPVPIGTSAYSQDFEYQVQMDDPAADEWYNIPIIARIQVGQKYLNGMKIFRVTHTPEGMNPVIAEVELLYIHDNQSVEEAIINADTVTIPDSVANVALTAVTETLEPGQNDTLVYRWYVSGSKNSGHKLHFQTDSADIETLLGSGAEASESDRSAVLSLRGKDGKSAIQAGIYDVYLVVRDNASAAQSIADERYGTDFIYFTIHIEG